MPQRDIWQYEKKTYGQRKRRSQYYDIYLIFPSMRKLATMGVTMSIDLFDPILLRLCVSRIPVRMYDGRRYGDRSQRLTLDEFALSC